MSKLKIISLTALIIGVNSGALACNKPVCSTPKVISCNTNQCACPCNNRWRLGVSALYLRPNFGGNGLGYNSFSNYGTDFFNNTVEINGAPNHLNNIVPNRAWGFQLEGAYDFGCNNDLDINWYHLRESTHGRFPTGTLFAGSASALYAGAIKVNPQWDAVDVEVGQRFDLNPANALRFHVGLEYSKLQTTFTNFPQLTPTGNPIFVTTDRISYTGIGPLFGGDYIYHSCCGLGFYVEAAGGLLVGTAKQSVSGYRDLGGFNLYSTGNYNQTNNNVVIPKLLANLGLKYDYKLRCGTLSFDAGYMFVTYLGALVSQVGTGVVSSSISTSSSTNFNLNGPHIGITWTQDM